MSIRIANIADVRAAEQVVRQHVSPAPLIRSYALERELKLPPPGAGGSKITAGLPPVPSSCSEP